MNLFLSRGCNERCAFCYASDFFGRAPTIDKDALFAALDRYAALVRDAPPLPVWSEDLDEFAMTFFASRSVNLLGGEPTIHPLFVPIVEAIAEAGLGPIVFTNGSRPDRIQAVADKLWSITINGHFAERAPNLGFDIRRIFANLPVRPTDDVIEHLQKIADAGIRGVFMAFATPVGGADPNCFTPDDQDEMRRVHARALAFCEDHGIHLGYDCSFPLCVDERVKQTKCTSVPVMNTAGDVTICGGEYSYKAGLRHIDTFDSLDAMHRYTFGLIQGLRERPSQFDVCNACPEFNRRCHGMCLAYRKKPAKTPLVMGDETQNHPLSQNR
ncbi:MAG: radical SAM protein [Myxococcota bacterium]